MRSISGKTRSTGAISSSITIYPGKARKTSRHFKYKRPGQLAISPSLVSLGSLVFLVVLVILVSLFRLVGLVSLIILASLVCLEILGGLFGIVCLEFYPSYPA